jgi:predicted RecB family nuclease
LSVSPGNKLHEAGFVYLRAKPRAVMSELVQVQQSELAKVESWRLHVLIEAGYPVTLAERLAASGADLHHAVELIARGCAPETAAEILL